jgi:hypothetical protein
LLSQGVFLTVAVLWINRLMMRTVARYPSHAVAVFSRREPQPATGSSLPD